MDFALSDEQEMLVTATRRLGADLFGPEVARQVVAGDHSAAEKGWAELQAAGLTTLLVPAEHGGGGGTLLDACLVLLELSAALAPVPYLGAAVAAPVMLAAYPGAVASELLVQLADGRTLGLVVDDQLRWPPGNAPAFCLDWQPGRSGLSVRDGVPVVVDDITPGTGVDLLHEVGVVAPGPERAGRTVEPTEAERRALAALRVAAAAALTGSLAGAATLAFDHIRDREQYGRPLASFQAVRHLAADVLVDLETCRSVTTGAAWMVDNEALETAERTAAIAKAWCGAAAVRSVETVVQLLGGIGVTWESTAHVHLRQVHLLAASLGDTATLLRRLGRDFIEATGSAGTEGTDHGSA